VSVSEKPPYLLLFAPLGLGMGLDGGMAEKGEQAGWTRWRRLALRVPMDERVLAEVLDGGQSFRWRREEGAWVGVFGKRVARIRAHAKGVEWCQVVGLPDIEDALAPYLDAEGGQAQQAEALPWRSDAFLREAMEAFPGLRILRQEPDEALLAFLCSSNKQILQIRRMVAALAEKLGDPISPGFHALPSWDALAKADAATLKACGLGYRAGFIRGTAQRLEGAQDWTRQAGAGSTAAAEAWLAELPGVGPKVASCVALFGLGRLDAFPVDTWIGKILAEGYGLQGWRREALTQFGRAHFGEAAGLAQQWLFARARGIAR
jgi:N-glycosylase/DNA lyase